MPINAHLVVYNAHLNRTASKSLEDIKVICKKFLTHFKLEDPRTSVEFSTIHSFYLKEVLAIDSKRALEFVTLPQSVSVSCREEIIINNA